VDQVATVNLPVNLGDRRENFEAQFTPEARDANGARVAGVTIAPNTVTATVAVERVGRTVSIVPNIPGEPPEGYRVRDTSVSPPSVTIDGPAEVLSQLIVVSTTPIDLTGRRETFSVFDVGLQLPAGTRMVERTPINVEVRIEAEQQRQQVNVRVSTITDPGFRATLTPPEIIVVLSGSRERLSQLRSDDVRAELDLRGLSVGTYSLAPRITVPSDLRYDPASPVRVQIDRIATPTLSPTITPTPPPTPTPTVAPPPPAPPPSGRRDGPLVAARLGR
jgi:YbbR domain-containing protein